MKLFQLLVLLAHGISVARASCAANNCIRAVTGTANKNPDVTSRKNDCSSAQRVTTSSSTATVTFYQTITAQTLVLTATTTLTVFSGTFTFHPTLAPTLKIRGEEDKFQLEARAPTAVPKYATACTNVAQYLSACSCWGVTATTITVPAATVSTTITITATFTSISTSTITSILPATTVIGCPVGQDQCSDGCKDLRRDPNNCGFCGVSCPDGVCGNGYCSNPACTDVVRCNDPKTCTGFDGSCACMEGVSGNFCGTFYGSCFASPKCTVDTDCPADGRCVTPTGTCCGVSICYRVGPRGGICDNPHILSRVFRGKRGALAVEIGELAPGDRMPQ
ncbi:hypothetical protein TWF694_001807 [Orbilia ellipsospora]|uniref:Uncharacterized protein n=1 Tax=Orbilia ellipsospora TaxID=2528407 RepID=A0AAV9X9S5_9PEZI